MHSGKSEKPENWVEWAERDDRALLAELDATLFDPAICGNRLFPWLHSIVTSLSIDSHSRWGLLPSKENTQHHASEFLRWMNREKEWPHISKSFASLEDGPWSLPLFLSRSYTRFSHSRRRNFDAHSASPVDANSADVQHFTQLANEIGEALISDLSFHVQSMEDPSGRLCLQLYLDGLIPQEIAGLTRLSLVKVEEQLRQAKRLLKGDTDESEMDS